MRTTDTRLSCTIITYLYNVIGLRKATEAMKSRRCDQLIIINHPNDPIDLYLQ